MGNVVGTTGAPAPYRAKWWSRLDDGRLRCELCPRECTLHDGQKGFCFTRSARGGVMYLDTYGRCSGFGLDPVEKKPLFHFLPGSKVLSFGTAGCNLNCKFCQNWDISKARENDRLTVAASPDEIAALAQHHGARSIAYTYNDPTIFAEYAIDSARAAHELGLRTIAVTAGYISPAPRQEMYAVMDAANIDLKGFSEDFYWRLTGAHLRDVLETIEYVCHQTDCWVELTNLVIPGHNDSDEELRELSNWIFNSLGPNVPLHFSAFHPDWKMRHIPPTPPETLRRARDIALESGLRFVYTGNVRDPVGATTSCHNCGAPLITRDWFEIRENKLADEGRCDKCGTIVPGIWI